MEITFFVVWTLFCVLTGWITGDHNARRRRSKIIDSLNKQVSHLFARVGGYEDIISSLNDRLGDFQKAAAVAMEDHWVNRDTTEPCGICGEHRAVPAGVCIDCRQVLEDMQRQGIGRTWAPEVVKDHILRQRGLVEKEEE
jgi:hypothetical protein